jgi:hypothetical protein
MTKQELNELKRLAKFLWNQASLMEKDGNNRLRAADLIDYSSRKAKADAYRHTSTLLSMKLEKLQGNRNKNIA